MPSAPHAEVYAALGHPLRLQMVTYLASRPPGGAYVGELVTHLRRAQSTVGHHLKVLCDAGVLIGEAHGRWTWYRVAPQRIVELSEHLSMLIMTNPALGLGVVG
jgi:ArsR family transcriptional regulator